ncbi:hypothetical protein ACIQWS_20065 [Phyllobacterium sp. NPDC097923]|uniref:hypothetical protein n=1 Tax=Phyllobacterium sp. NPDC097923 TaxID=3364404 RepID=UPI00383A4646
MAGTTNDRFPITSDFMQLASDHWASDMTTPHGKFCNKAAVIVASCELTGCKNWRDFIRLSSGIYKEGEKLTKLGV